MGSFEGGMIIKRENIQSPKPGRNSIFLWSIEKTFYKIL